MDKGDGQDAVPKFHDMELIKWWGDPPKPGEVKHPTERITLNEQGILKREYFNDEGVLVLTEVEYGHN